MSWVRPVTLPPSGYDPTADGSSMVVAVGVESSGEAGVVVGISAGTNTFVDDHVVKVVKKRCMKALVRLLARMPFKQAVVPMATKAPTSIPYIQRAVDVSLTSSAGRTADQT